MNQGKRSILAICLLMIISLVIVPKGLYHDHDHEDLNRVFVKEKMDNSFSEEAPECSLCDLDQSNNFEECKLKNVKEQKECKTKILQFRILERLFEEILEKNSSRAPPSVG